MQLTAMESRKGFGKGRGYGGFQVGRGRKNAKMCAYCGKIGHTIEICYKKHGYQPNFGFERSNTLKDCPALKAFKIINNIKKTN
jgi:hypothetical protein